MSVKKASSNNLNEILSSPKLNLIKFYAEWCGPCKMLSPIYNEVSSEINDVDFYEADIDDEGSENLVNKYSINVVPTVILIKNGEKVDEFSGFVPKDVLVKLINDKK